MKNVLTYAIGSVLPVVFLVLVSNPAARAEVQSGQVLIKAVSGDVSYSLTGRDWQPLKAGGHLTRGVMIKTGAAATADLILEYNGTVLRLLPDSQLAFAQLDEEQAGEETVTETSLTLMAGGIVGSQRKLAAMSHFEIKTPGGVTTIKGTEYVVRADGAVSVLSGAVTERYNLPGNKGSVTVTIQAGFSFNPATGQVVPTTPDYLVNLIAHINTVQQNALTFKVSGGANVVVKPTTPISPTAPSQLTGLASSGVNSKPQIRQPVSDSPASEPIKPGKPQSAHSQQN